ncbi:ATP-binding cassette domain-containing protein, partial [bacterium]|nr:ATP-binding cassette domain-containing protein [bacterium]
HNLSFELKPGERIAFFAPSGAGKTTLIRILAGLDSATSGSLQVNDPLPTVLFQEPRLFPYMTVEENIRLPWRINKMRWTVQTQLDYQHWLNVCELNAWKDHYPFQLSGGMRQKAAIIRGLLHDPALALMDEPFQSIGQGAKSSIIDFIKTRYPNMTILMATHSLDEIPLLTDSVYYFASNQLETPSKLDSFDFQSLFSRLLNPVRELAPSH